MSALRDIRILVARSLEAPTNVRACVMDVLNILDADLDAQGYSEPPELTIALRALDKAIINDDVVEEEDDLILDDDIDEEIFFVDIGEFPNLPSEEDDIDD